MQIYFDFISYFLLWALFVKFVPTVFVLLVDEISITDVIASYGITEASAILF